MMHPLFCPLRPQWMTREEPETALREAASVGTVTGDYNAGGRLGARIPDGSEVGAGSRLAVQGGWSPKRVIARGIRTVAR